QRTYGTGESDALSRRNPRHVFPARGHRLPSPPPAVPRDWSSEPPSRLDGARMGPCFLLVVVAERQIGLTGWDPKWRLGAGETVPARLIAIAGHAADARPGFPARQRAGMPAFRSARTSAMEFTRPFGAAHLSRRMARNNVAVDGHALLSGFK